MANIRTVQVIGKRILVRERQSEVMTEGGLHIPESVQKRVFEADVIAVGDGCRENVKPGDHIIFERNAGWGVGIDGVDICILDESDVVGVIDDEKWIQITELKPPDRKPLSEYR